MSSAPSRLPSSVPAAAFLRADDRRALDHGRVELYIVHVDTTERDGSYGQRCLYWLVSPDWPTGTERVLDLSSTIVRRRQLDELRDALRRAARVGPYRLVRRSAADRVVWALVSTAEADAQLELE